MKKLLHNFTMTFLLVAGTSLLLSPVALAGDVTGSVNYDGDRPKAERVRLIGDQVCVQMHTKDGKVEAPFDDSLVVSESLKIKNVFVYIERIEGDFSAPEQSVVLDQRGCVYTPHVLGMVVGQTLDIRNSDPTLHNVRCEAEENKSFNLGQRQDAEPMYIEMQRPEIGVPFSCDVHPWMSAYVNVVDNPFFAVTDSEGKYQIKDVPPGRYTLIAWHERLEPVEQEITVGAGAATKANFTFEPEEEMPWMK